MQEKIKNIKETILNNLQNIKDINSLTELKNKYLSKKGEISGLLANLGSMDIEERKTYGSLVNTLKQEVTKLIRDRKSVV